MKIVIIFGGNSQEKGISINSARACFEILNNVCNLELHYLSIDGNVYLVDEKTIYSNTPDDFDFTLFQPIQNYWHNLSCNFVIPVIHGIFGEDGQIQQILEKLSIPFLFSQSISCQQMFFKNSACNFLWNNGFNTWNSYVFDGNYQKLQQFFAQQEILIVKPIDGGSSIDVHVFDDYDLLVQFLLINKHRQWIIEEKHDGKEFSIVVENGISQLPIEIIYSGNILNYRDKYFPTNDVQYLNPPNLSYKIIETIQKDCNQIFKLFNARDVIRVDGRIKNNNKLIYTDINPIPSMEFNSVFFQSFFENNYIVFERLLNRSLSSYNLPNIQIIKENNKIKIPVLMGGDSSERQVSLVSGASTCMKLIKSKKYLPVPYILYQSYVYKVPLYLIFKHSIEDVILFIKNNNKNTILLQYFNKPTYNFSKSNLIDFLNQKDINFIFIALHGGMGEDGTLQSILEDKKISFNGENSIISKLCINKMNIIQKINTTNIDNIQNISRQIMNYPYIYDQKELAQFIQKNKKIIIKPIDDGSSVGITLIQDIEELNLYIDALINKKKYIIINNQKINTEFYNKNLLLEQFVEVDKILFQDKKINHIYKQGWLELTIGCFSQQSFIPSITIANKAILSSEEKFQSGTGINLTPPPNFLITPQQIKLIQNTINKILVKLKLEFYCRIDFMFNIRSNKLIIFDINSLPALTFSTVIFHQIMYQNISLTQFIELLIEKGMKRYKNNLC